MDRTPKRRRRTKRSRRRFAFMTGFIVLFLVAFATLSMTVFFNIHTFSIEGDVPYSLEDVVKASGLSIGDNLFRMNKFKIQDALVEKLPYIKTARIDRRFPEGLCFVLTAAEEAALVSVEDGYYVIDASSKYLRKVDKRDYAPALPVVLNANVTQAGPGRALEYKGARTAENLSLLLSLLKENGCSGKVTEIDVAKSYDTTMFYEGRVECHLGTTEHLDIKLRFIKNIIEAQPDGEKAVIDAQDYTTIRYKKKNE